MILLNFIKKNHTSKILGFMEIIFVDMKGKEFVNNWFKNKDD